MRPCLFALGVLAVAASASTLHAQDARCTDTRFVGPAQLGGDACQKVIDIYNYMNIQFGTLVAGGNATLGQSGNLGGFGHFAVGVHANAMATSIPDIAQTGISLGPVGAPQTFVTNTYFVPLPAVDAAVGVFQGFPLGLTSIGGVDLLVSATALPSFTEQSVRVKTVDHPYDFGFGARIGLMRETFATPGISFTYFRRDLPKTTITATASASDSVTVEDYQLKTSAWRLTAGKSFAIIGVAAGIGQDKYDANATLTYDVSGTRPTDSLTLGTKPTRTNVFVDLSLNLAVLKIVGEAGHVAGGSVTTYNIFDPVANEGRWYFSLGLRGGL